MTPARAPAPRQQDAVDSSNPLEVFSLRQERRERRVRTEKDAEKLRAKRQRILELIGDSAAVPCINGTELTDEAHREDKPASRPTSPRPLSMPHSYPQSPDSSISISPPGLAEMAHLTNDAAAGYPRQQGAAVLDAPWLPPPGKLRPQTAVNSTARYHYERMCLPVVSPAFSSSNPSAARKQYSPDQATWPSLAVLPSDEQGGSAAQPQQLLHALRGTLQHGWSLDHLYTRGGTPEPEPRRGWTSFVGGFLTNPRLFLEQVLRQDGRSLRVLFPAPCPGQDLRVAPFPELVARVARNSRALPRRGLRIWHALTIDDGHDILAEACITRSRSAERVWKYWVEVHFTNDAAARSAADAFEAAGMARLPHTCDAISCDVFPEGLLVHRITGLGRTRGEARAGELSTQFFVTKQSDGVVAVCRLAYTNEEIGSCGPTIHMLEVHPRWRRQGVGTLLVRLVERLVSDTMENVPILPIQVSHVIAGREFLQSLGYTFTDSRQRGFQAVRLLRTRRSRVPAPADAREAQPESAAYMRQHARTTGQLQDSDYPRCIAVGDLRFGNSCAAAGANPAHSPPEVTYRTRSGRIVRPSDKGSSFA